MRPLLSDGVSGRTKPGGGSLPAGGAGLGREPRDGLCCSGVLMGRNWGCRGLQTWTGGLVAGRPLGTGVTSLIWRPPDSIPQINQAQGISSEPSRISTQEVFPPTSETWGRPRKLLASNMARGEATALGHGDSASRQGRHFHLSRWNRSNTFIRELHLLLLTHTFNLYLFKCPRGCVDRPLDILPEGIKLTLFPGIWQHTPHTGKGPHSKAGGRPPGMSRGTDAGGDVTRRR